MKKIIGIILVMEIAILIYVVFAPFNLMVFLMLGVIAVLGGIWAPIEGLSVKLASPTQYKQYNNKDGDSN